MAIIGHTLIYPVFKWFDFWIGVYYDKKENILYIFPIPMFGIVLNFGKRVNASEQAKST